MTAPTLFVQGAGGTSVNFGSRRYATALGCGSIIPAGTTEATGLMKIPVAGTISDFYHNATSNTHSTDTPVIIRVAGSDTPVAVTQVANVPAMLSTANTAAVSANDTISVAFDFAAGTGTFASTCSLKFTPAGGTVSSYCAFDNNTGTTWSGSGPLTFYAPPVGQMSASTSSTIGPAQFTMPIAGQANNLQAYCGTNGRASSDSTATFNVAGSDTSMVITFPAGVSGSYQLDSTNTAAVAANNLVTCKIGLGTGTGNFILTALGFWMTATVDGESACAAAAVAGSSLAAATTAYNAPSGRLGGFSTTNTSRTVPFGGAATTSKLAVAVLTNASLTDVTVNLAVNTSVVNQTLTLTASVAPASYQDGSNSDAVVAGDQVNLKFAGGTVGAVVINATSLKVVTAALFTVGEAVNINQAVNRASTF